MACPKCGGESLNPPLVELCLACRSEEIFEAEADQERQLYWLSFAGEEGFLGCCVVEANGMLSAVRLASELGINPGGQVVSWILPWEYEDNYPKNKLMSHEDLKEIEARHVTGGG